MISIIITRKNIVTFSIHITPGGHFFGIYTIYINICQKSLN